MKEGLLWEVTVRCVRQSHGCGPMRKGKNKKREMIEAKLVVLSLSVCKGSDNISK